MLLQTMKKKNAIFLILGFVGLLLINPPRYPKPPYSNLSAAEPKQSPAATAIKLPKDGKLFDGKSLKGWRVADKFDFMKHGKVEVDKGEIILGQGKPASGIAWTGPLPRINYELTLEAKRTEGNDFFCGLTFPFNKEYCTLILGGWGGGTTGLSNIDEMSAVDNETTGYSNFKQNQWYAVRLRVEQHRIRAWVGDELIVDVQAKDRKFSIWWEQEPMRPLGIATWNTKAALRNIRLTALAEKKPAAKK